VTYSIPDAKLGLTWREIKQAANSFTWGRYRATANLNNQRQMAVYGASPAAARSKLKELLRLSTAEILTLSISEEEERDPRLRKEPTQMYPAFATLFMRRSSVDGQGRVLIDGRDLDETLIRIPLYPKDEPANLPPLR